MPMHFGLQLWPQQTTWPAWRDAALAAEASGWDAVFTWDHLMAIFGPWEQPEFEGWSMLAGLAPLTRRVRLSLMVGANTFRNPGLTAKIASTVDHLSDGRVTLGIGAAWFEREHEAFGLDFGATPGERLDRLDESVAIMRRLLDGERFSHAGPVYQLDDAVLAPRPVQAHLPILIGGSGRRKTLRIVAERADAWNTAGDLATVTDALSALRGHADTVGRDLSTLEMTVSFPIVIDDDATAAQTRLDALLAANGTESIGPGPHLVGPPEVIADGIRPFRDLGFSMVVVRMPAPYDHQTIERMGEVRAALEA